MNDRSLLDGFAARHVVVLGDAILDVYVDGGAERVCREAPVPVVTLDDERKAAGGAANVAANVASMGAEARFVSVVGDDADGDALADLLRAARVHPGRVLPDRNRTTIAKRRVVADGQLLLRLDSGTTSPLSAAMSETVRDALRGALIGADALIVSDYALGLLSPTLMAALPDLLGRFEGTLVIDSTRLSAFRYLQPDLVKPSLPEALVQLQLAGLEPSSRPDLAGALGDALLELTGARIVALTLDEDGAVVFDESGEVHRVPAAFRGQAHPAGAGDTFLAAFTLALSGDAPVSEAARIASAAAGIVVAEPGTSRCSQRQLSDALSGQNGKVLSDAELAEEIERLRQSGRRIVFTNGCFDIIHPGHIALLEQAKRLGDVLVVGVNTDGSVARLKGPERPVNSLEHRLRVLSALTPVDYLVAFEEPTAIRLIELVRPDVYVKGGDYRPDAIPEAPAVSAAGGRIEILPFYGAESTSRVIARIRGLARDA